MNTKKEIMPNLVWRFAERCGAQGITFIVSIVLARILAPEVYGTIALVTVFTTILQVFVDSGLGSSLIQKKDADDLDFSSVFYFNLIICLVLYIGIYFVSPLIAEFYKDSELVPVIRVLSLTLVISGVKNIQQAYISRTLQFKKFFFATLGGTIAAAIVGIAMAYLGFGVWALVVQQILNAAVDTIIMWVTVKWKPKRMFSFKRLKGLLSFGWKLLFSSLLDTVYNNVRQLIIGRMYSSSDLAYYNKGKQFPHYIITNVNSTIDSILFPVISTEQDDVARVKTITRRAIRTSSFIIWPVVMGLAACAEPLVRILLTDKWLSCVPYLRIFCITYGFWPIHTANLNTIKAVGRSDILLRLEILKKCIGVISIIATMNYGVMAIAIAMLITAPISAAINATPNRKLIQYSYREQLHDILPSLLLSVTMGILVYFITEFDINIYLILVIQIITGTIVYIGGAYLLHFESFQYLLSFINERKHNSKK